MEKLQKICKIILDNPDIELKVLKKKIKHKPQDLEDLKTHLLQHNLFLHRTFYTRLKETGYREHETYKITLSIKKCHTSKITTINDDENTLNGTSGNEIVSHTSIESQPLQGSKQISLDTKSSQ